MDLSVYKTLALRRDGFVLNVTFNLPDKMNPLSPDILTELLPLLKLLESDEETRVVVLSGAGRAFSAGGDLNRMTQQLEKPLGFSDRIPHIKEVVHAFLDFPKPIIAKINGPAIGLGATVALLCDITFAAADAKIADTHIKMGLVPGDGGTFIWPLLVGINKAKRFLLTGDSLTGEEAERIGLISAAFPREELDSQVNAFAQRLANGAPRAVQFTKLAMNVALKQNAGMVLDAAVAYEVLSSVTGDYREALTALVEKRAVQFSGK